MQETIYQELLRFASVYRKGTQDIVEMANICFLEFLEGNYMAVYESFPPPGQEPFLRKFVKVRCYRELTKHSKVIPVEDLSYIGDSHNPYSRMEEAVSDKVEDQVMGALKEQEQIVLDLLMDGATRREIAARIGRSLGTVQNIIERIKLNPVVQKLRESVYGDN